MQEKWNFGVKLIAHEIDQIKQFIQLQHLDLNNAEDAAININNKMGSNSELNSFIIYMYKLFTKLYI